MASGALPWEASRAALDLLRYFAEHGRGRPTIRHVKWFWYLRLAAPEIETEIAHKYAALLQAVEYAQTAEQEFVVNLAGLERELAFQPWRSDADRAAHEAAVARYGEPLYGPERRNRIARWEGPGTEAFLKRYLIALAGEAEGQRLLGRVQLWVDEAENQERSIAILGSESAGRVEVEQHDEG
jgi:hypothetical protein